MSHVFLPEAGAGAGISSYANLASFPVGSPGDIALALDTNDLYSFNGTDWVIIGPNAFAIFSTVADARLGNANGLDSPVCYIIEKEAFYNYCTDCGLPDDSDLIISTIDGGATRWEMVQKVSRTQGDTGWIDRNGILVTKLNTTTMRLSLAANAYYAVNSKRVTLPPGNYDISFTGTPRAIAVYLDENAALQQSNDVPGALFSSTPVAVVYWTGTTIGDIQTEFHGIRDTVWHTWAHRHFGTQYNSGLSITTNTQPDSGADPTVETVQYLWLTTGVISDEDTQITVGTGNWAQTLGSGLSSTTAAAIPFIYYNAGIANIKGEPANPNREPFLFTGANGYPQWENAGVLTAGLNGDYIVYHYFASPFIDGKAVFARPHNAKFSSLITAQAARPSAIDWSITGVSLTEWKHIYTVVFRLGNWGNTPTHNCKIVNVQDFRLVASGPSTATSASAHGALSGLTDPNAHPASSIAPDTTNFNGEFSTSENTVQLALDRIDDYDSILDYAAGREYRIGNTVVQDGAIYRCSIAVVVSTNWATDRASFVQLAMNRFATIAAAEAASGNNTDLSYVVETDTFYKYLAAGSTFTRDGTYVLNTAQAGNTRRIGVSGRYVAQAAAFLSTVSVDTINERTSGAGVAIDSAVIKDGAVRGLQRFYTNAALATRAVSSWTERTTPADNTWVVSCWSPELGLFVATAQSGTGNRVMTSPDGINWTIRTSAADVSWTGVCWSSELGRFCACANSAVAQQFMTSSDGITWTIQSGANSNAHYSICWAAALGLFVASGTTAGSSHISTSPDGINWTAQTTPDNQYIGICWSPELNLLCAVSTTGPTAQRVITSPDGVNWTTRTAANNNNYYEVCWSAELGLFAAVSITGTLNRVMTSPDGITWTARTTNDNSWISIAWSPELGLFCACAITGTTDRIMTSPDGVNWTTRTSSALNQYNICWSPELGIFLTVCASGISNRAVTSRYIGTQYGRQEAFSATKPGTVSSSTSGITGIAGSSARSDHSHDLGVHTHDDNATGGAISVLNNPTNASAVSDYINRNSFASGTNLQSATFTFGSRGVIMAQIDINTDGGFVIAADYKSTIVNCPSDPSGLFLPTDAGTGIVVTKSANSAVITVKNRTGATKTIGVLAIRSQITAATAWA